MKIFFLFLMLVITTTILHAQTPSQDSLKEYTGKYKFPEGSTITEVTVTLDNGILYGSSDMGSSELRRIVKDTFEVVAYGGMATFKRDSSGKVSGVHIVVGDTNIEGEKKDSLSLSKIYNLYPQDLFHDRLKESFIYLSSKVSTLKFYARRDNS